MNEIATSPATTRVHLHPSWLRVIGDEFDQPYMKELRRFLQEEKQAGKVIYPPAPLWFNALDSTPFERVKVVILGQDPYHGPNQAHGLCFSVQPGVRPPPSLVNMFKELQSDLGIAPSPHGCLQHWADQGVLLLNAVLTVEQGMAGSHQQRGWERFTDACVRELDAQREGLVFMLWGSHAQRKGALIDRQRHCVLQAPHPSPLSAHRGFLGCRHFSRANEYLEARGETSIDWALPPP
jgi:uracil-DNA glycosylase